MAELSMIAADYSAGDISGGPGATAIMDGGSIAQRRAAARAVILFWFQVTTNATTTVTVLSIFPRDMIPQVAVGEGNAEQIKAAGGQTESMFRMGVSPELTGAAIRYSGTQNMDGGAPITALQRCLVVFGLD